MAAGGIATTGGGAGGVSTPKNGNMYEGGIGLLGGGGWSAGNHSPSRVTDDGDIVWLASSCSSKAATRVYLALWIDGPVSSVRLVSVSPVSMPRVGLELWLGSWSVVMWLRSVRLCGA